MGGIVVPARAPDPSSSRETARTAATLILLPLLGALLAYRLTTPPGPGPLGFVRVAEAPPAEVAGARAVDDPLGLSALAGLRAPVGTASGDPSLQLRTALPRPGETGGVLTFPDGLLIRVPGEAVTGAWPATVGTSVTALAVPAPIALATVEGVLGVADSADEPARPRSDPGASGASGPAQPAVVAHPTSPSSPGGPTGELLFQALEPPPAGLPGPLVHKLFAVVALAPDGVPVGRFTTPLTITLPYTPETVTGRLSLASFDPSAGWVELPARAINPQRAIVSAQLPQPAVVALIENRAPIAVPDAAETDADAPMTLDVLTNDSDPDGDPIAVFERSTTSAAGGDVRCTQLGACTYTPPPGFTGEDTFAYGLGDLRNQAWSDNMAEGTVTVLVRATPDR